MRSTSMAPTSTHAHQLRKLKGSITALKRKNNCAVTTFWKKGNVAEETPFFCAASLMLIPVFESRYAFHIDSSISRADRVHRLLWVAKKKGRKAKISQLKEITTKHAPHHTIRLAYPDTYNLPCLSCSPFSFISS